MRLPARVLDDVLGSQVLHLILCPTEACNFRCTYCYEDFELGRMRPDVIAGVEALLSRRAEGLSGLTLSWFGGEPLVAADVVVRILRHVERLRGEHRRLRLHSDMTTNGWHLTKPLFDDLQALGVTKYQVSFDGPPEFHDRKRVRRGGGGSFDRIWGNLRAIGESDRPFSVTMRLHVDRENAAACPAFLARLKADFGGDRRFPVHFRLLSRWGGPNDARLDVFGEECGRAAVRRLEELATAMDLPLHHGGEDGGVCYAARGNSFLIRADGRVNKCTVALNAPENQVGRLTEDGRLLLDAHRMAPWMRGLWNASEEELKCPMTGLVDPAPGALSGVA